MLITSLSCIYSASWSFEEAYVKFKIKVSEKVKSEMSRLRTQANLVPLPLLQTDNSSQTKTILFQNFGSLHLWLHLHIYMMCEVITTFKKLMSTFLLNQNFARQIEMMHISFVNLLFAEITFVSLT